MKKQSKARRGNENVTWRGLARRRGDEEAMSIIDHAAPSYSDKWDYNFSPLLSEINNLLEGSAWCTFFFSFFFFKEFQRSFWTNIQLFLG